MDLQLIEKPVVSTEPLRDRVQSIGAEAQQIAAYVSELARNIVEVPPSSRSFVGFIRDYRYTVGRKGEMPTHRFYVECDGGVWLYSRNEAKRFEQMMKDMDEDGDEKIRELSADTLNGRLVVCTAMPDTNSVVPVAFVEPLQNFEGGVVKDRFGSILYEGAPVFTYVESVRARCEAVKMNNDGYLVVKGADEATATVLSNEVTRTF